MLMGGGYVRGLEQSGLGSAVYSVSLLDYHGSKISHKNVLLDVRHDGYVGLPG